MERDTMLRREEEAWRDFAGVLASVPTGRRDVEGVVPGWSAHDLLWHCAYWTEFAGGVLEKIRGGEADPEAGAQPEADILAEGRRASWDAALARTEAGRGRARAALSRFDDAIPDLAAQWFREDTFEHYDEHAEQIRVFNV
jgi:DinB superfamily